MLVTIIIPAYNAESFIDRCMESVINQTYKDLQIIVINDGSTDNTLSVLKEYEKQDNRILVVDQENIGVADTRNHGLDVATGDYVLYVDSDDWIEQNMVETMVKALNEKEQVDIVVCGSDHAETKEEAEKSSHNIDIWSKEKTIKEFLIHREFQGMLWNKLIKRSLFDGLRFDSSIGYAEDALVMWDVFNKNDKVAVITDKLYHHVLEKTSISHQRFSPIKYDIVKVWGKILKDVENDNNIDNLVLTQERLAFYATFTLFEMYRASYVDNDEEAKLIAIIKKYKRLLLKSSNISAKTKAFIVALTVSKGIAKKLL